MCKTIVKRIAVCSLMLACAGMVNSCVNEQYEISEEKLDLNVTIFQEGLSLPLGSVSNITLGSLMSEMDEDTQKLIKKLEGAYLFGYSDSIDLTEDLQEALSDLDNLESVSMNEKFSFNLSNVDLSSVSFEGRNINPVEVNISDMMEIPDIKLPKINESVPGISIELPALKAEDLTLDLSKVMADFSHDVTVVSLAKPLEVPSRVKDNDIYTKPINYTSISKEDSNLLELLGLDLPEMSTSYELEEYNVNVPIQITLPKEIQSVKSIKLDKEAKFEMILKMENPLFTDGSFAPELTINLHDLFHVDMIESGREDGGFMDHYPEEKNPVEHHIHDKFVMSAPSWTADHIYHIDSLAVSQSDWKTVGESLVLDKEVAITLSGKLTTTDLMTTLKHLEEAGKNPMKLKIDIKFLNFRVDDVHMNIKPVTESQDLEMSFAINKITLPEMVKKVDYVEFDKKNPLKLKMSASVPDMCNTMDISLETLKIEFPKGIVIEHGASDAGVYDSGTRTLTYSDVKLSEGLDEEIKITKLDLEDPVGGVISYDGKVKVTALASAKGMISSKNILNATGSKTLSVDVEVGYSPVLSDYCVLIDEYIYDVEVEPTEINTEISSEIAEVFKDKPISVTLKEVDGENPRIIINLNYPKDIPALKIFPKKGEGLKFDFPDMINFAASSVSDFNYDPETNIIIFSENDKIPDEINLEITGISVLPVEENGKYFVKDRLEISGGVRLAATEIHMDDVETIKDKDVKISFDATIPTLTPAEVGLDEYVASVSEVVEIDPIEVELPEMIKSISVSELLLKDVYLNLNVDASRLYELSGAAKMTLKMDVTLPKMLIIEGVVNGKLSVEQDFENGVLELEPIKVNGLNLSDLKISEGQIKIDNLSIAVDGTLTVSDLKVDVDKLEGEEVEVAIVGSLATIGEDNKPTDSIEIDTVVGRVDTGIDPVSTDLDLSSIAEVINGGNVSFFMDINNFWLSLDVKTNIDIPVKAKLEVTPCFGEEEGQKTVIDLNLDPEKKVDDEYRIYISNKDPQSPELVYINLDLTSLLYKENDKKEMASCLKVNLTAGTDPDKDCVIKPTQGYFFTAEYEVGVPFQFGENFSFEYRDKITDLPEALGQLMTYVSLGLGGEIVNGLPFRCDLQLRLLDSKGNVIPMHKGAGKMQIAPCDPTGRPVTTSMNLVLGGIDKNSADLHSIEFVFTIDSKGAAGVPLKENSCIQIKNFYALVPQGITLDMSGLFSEDGGQAGAEGDNN